MLFRSGEPDASPERMLGGLGEAAEGLSSHLKSRQETGDALRSAGVPVIEFRASIIVGPGSFSFDLVRTLVERLPAISMRSDLERKRLFGLAPDADSESPEALRDLLAARSVNDPMTLTGSGGQIAFVWQAPLGVSATRIRQFLASGRSVRFLVPDAVLAYINAHGLYRASN